MANDARELVDELKDKEVLKSPALVNALLEIDRADFVPEELRDLAYQDVPLPIGSGQTISQPYTVVFMLEHLDVKPGQKILEIGYGSGWQTALLAYIAGAKGEVFAMEIVPGLCKWGEDNVRKFPELLTRIRLICRSAEQGYGEGAPYDRIIAAAEVKKAPRAWREQLRIGGKMIYPQDSGLTLELKSEHGFEQQRIPGFVFVPFV